MKKDRVLKERLSAGRGKKAHLFLTVVAMFFLITALLLSSFQIVIYGDSDYGFYEKKYVKYQVTEELHMTLEDVMDVTDVMMDYLIGKKEELSVETTIDGRRMDFFNEQDRLHMADVKNLFLGGLRLRTGLLAAAVLLLLVLALLKADLGNLLFQGYSISVGIFAALLVFLGIALAVDFTQCFRIFHEIFFTNDLWLFDPATDYMIRMLPEGFFFDMVLRIAAVFTAFLLLGIAAVFVIKKAVGMYRDKRRISDHPA